VSKPLEITVYLHGEYYDVQVINAIRSLIEIRLYELTRDDLRRIKEYTSLAIDEMIANYDPVK